MRFVHLHNHTHYSLLDGLTKVDELIQAAKDDGAPAVAITDHGVMYGAVEFYQKCKKSGIKPIIGLEAYMAPSSLADKSSKTDERNYHLILLAKNMEGYKNLIKLTTIAHLEGYYYKPRIDWEALKRHSQGLVCLSACLAGEIPQLIKAGKTARARKRALDFKNLFGEGNYYLELQYHAELAELKPINAELIRMSGELGIPLAATNDIHYLKPEDYDVQDVLLCLQTKRKKDETDRMEMQGRDYYYRSGREMEEIFAHIPEALENTLKIAEMCELTIDIGHAILPHFEVPSGYDEDSYLKKLCLEGFARQYGRDGAQAPGEAKERLEFELSVIQKMKFSPYFLIVADFVNWAKNNGIIVGPGRGSAAGSLVCYLAGITNLDPIKYELLFERFLNPDRISMPDIDLDFADVRREEVIRYVEAKYGKEHVAQIITFGTMAARAAVRDVGRVLGYPYQFCDKLAKSIPPMMKMDKALKASSELKELYEKDQSAKKIIEYARKLEGVARHSSTHACGVLITKEPLTEYVPLQHASSSDRTVISQYSLHPIEDLGLLKMDFLGLANLTIIESAIKIIARTRNLAISLDEIPLNDPMTYGLFQKGETTGVFQFESSGMKRYLRELAPSTFEDLIAMVALYRPGPMELIPDYIARKHQRKKITYLHKELEPILGKTYGVAIYQEQVMQISRNLAGFTKGEADVLRKAMGKKIADLLAEQKEKFIIGCIKHGINKEMADKIWAFIEPFAGYGFNRSHAACYALIAYQTAYLKAHWPTEFMAALLASDQQNADRVAIEIEECRNMGIAVLPPDINQSFESFTVVTSGTAVNSPAVQGEAAKTIRFGLKAIKNVGNNIAEVIISERKTGGPFKNLTDLLKRVQDKDLNKKSLESLAKSGSLDEFGERGILLANIEIMLNYNREAARSLHSSQKSLFGDLPLANFSDSIKLKTSMPASRQSKLAWEKELLGLYITAHPFSDYKQHIGEYAASIRQINSAKSDDEVLVAGIVISIKKIITKNSETMAFVKIEDDTDSIEILAFPRIFKEHDIWQEGKVLVCLGKLSDKDNENKILCNAVRELEIGRLKEIIAELRAAAASHARGPARLYGRPALSPARTGQDLHLAVKSNLASDKLKELYALLANYKGRDRVFFKISDKNNKTRTIESGFGIANNGNLKRMLAENFSDLVEVLDNSR